MAETLEIVIDITEPKKALEDLKTQAADAFKATGESAEKAAPPVQKLQEEMSKLKGPPPEAIDGTAKLGDAMGKLSAGPMQMISEKFKEMAGISFDTIVSSALVLLNVLKNIGIGLAAISFIGIVEAFKGLGAAIEAISSKMLTLLTRMAAFAAVAAILAPLALIAKAFMQAKHEADAFEASLHVSGDAMDRYHPFASKMAEDLKKQAEGFGMTKEKSELVSKAYLDLGRGLDVYTQAVERDIAKHEKQRDALNGTYDQLLRLVVGYEKIKEANGGLTAAQKNEEDALKKQLAAVGQLIDKNNMWINVMRGTVTGHEAAAAAARGEQGAVDQVVQAFGRGEPAAKKFVDALNESEKSGFAKWLGGAKEGIDNTGKSLFDGSRAWLGYRDAMKTTGDASAATSNSLFGAQDALAKQNEKLKNVDEATRKYVEALRIERDAQSASVSAARDKLAQLTNEAAMYSGIAGTLHERNKALQESLEVERGAAGASQSLINGIKAEMAANDANIASLYKKIDATNASHNALARESGQVEVSLASTKRSAEAAINAAQATEKLQASWSNTFAKITGGAQVFDVLSAKGENLGIVIKKTDGTIVATTSTLTKYTEEQRKAADAMGLTTTKQTDQQKAATEQAQKLQAIVAPLQAVSKSTAETTKTIDASAKAFNVFADTANKSATAFNTIALDVKTFEQSLALLPGSLKAANDSLPVFTTNIDILNKTFEDFPAKVNATAGGFAAMSSALPVVAAELPKVTEGFTQLATKAEAITKIGEYIKALADQFANFATQTDTAQQAVTKLSGATDSLKTGTDQLKSSTDSEVEAFHSAMEAAIALAAAYEKAAAAAKALKEAQGGGNSGGGGDVQQQKSGGIVGQSIDPTVKVDMSIFAHAPKFAQGGVVGGDHNAVPIIAHKGEGVVPLSGGRSIPVNLTGALPDPVPHLTIHTKLLQQLVDNTNGGIASGLNPPPKLVDGPSQRAIHGSDHRRAHPLRQSVDMQGMPILDANVPGAGAAGDGDPASQAQTPKLIQPTITVHMHGGRFDDFKLTTDQIVAAAQKALDKVKQQNG